MTESSTPLPEPSYARVVLIRIAEHLARQAPTTTVTDQLLQRAFTVGVAQELDDLAPHVSSQVIDQVDTLLPPLTNTPTVGAYVGQLRETARSLS